RRDLRDLPAPRGHRLVPLERAAGARALLPRTPGGVARAARLTFQHAVLRRDVRWSTTLERRDSSERGCDGCSTIPSGDRRGAALEGAVDKVRKLRAVGLGESLEEPRKQVVRRAGRRVDSEAAPLLMPDQHGAVGTDDLWS